MKKILIGILALCLVGCSKNSNTNTNFNLIEKEFNNFPNVYKLTGNKVQLLDNSNITFYQFHLIDSLLIVKDVYNKKKCLHIFNKNSFKLLASTGKRGKGPSEINNPAVFSINPFKNEIWLIDGSKYKAFKFDIKAVINNDSYLPDNLFDVNKKILPFWDMEWINEDTFAVINTATDKLITYYNKEGERLKEIGKKFHIKEKNAPLMGYKLSCNAHIDYSRVHNKIFMSFKYFDKLIGVNLEEKKYFTLTGPVNYNPNFQYKRGLLSTKKMNQMRGKIITNNNYIFTSFWGKKFWRHENGKPVTNNYDELHVFDLNGQPKVKFKFDRQINEFAIDEENQRIIAHDFSNNELIIYNLESNPVLQNYIVNDNQ